MSDADQFREYVRRGHALGRTIEDQKEKRLLIELARTWKQAAIESDRSDRLHSAGGYGRPLKGRLGWRASSSRLLLELRLRRRPRRSYGESSEIPSCNVPAL